MQAPTPVEDHFNFLKTVKGEAGSTGAAVAGFDFPIGIPARYAVLLGIEEFKSFHLQLGVGEFSDFFRICISSSQISYPRSNCFAGRLSYNMEAGIRSNHRPPMGQILVD